MEQWGAKARTTIELLVANMVNPAVVNKIFFQHYQEVNKENTIRLLYRGRRLYDARDRVTKILKALVELNYKMEATGAICRLMHQERASDAGQKALMQCVQLTSRLLLQLDSLREENKLFRNFCFKQEETEPRLREQGMVLCGFIAKVSGESPSFDDNGALIYDHGDGEKQRTAHTEWLGHSKEDHGELTAPTDDELLPAASKAKKTSRIQDVLDNMPKEKEKTPPKQRPQHRSISPVQSVADTSTYRYPGEVVHMRP